MGNHIPLGIPPLLAKNWQPVHDHPNSFRNKLTSQYTHKHIVNIQSALEIQSFKFRMKQTNLYICRVLFYHQYHESIYHVYTDQIHVQPNISKPDVWKLHKIKIMESFWQLAQKYGFMKVCRQMIGADSSGHPKIWIHPDPVAGKPWSACDSQSTMVTQILNILQNIQQRVSNKQKKIIGNTLMSNSQIQYTTFQQFITTQTQLLTSQYSQTRSKVNRSSAILQNQVNSLTTSSQLINIKRTRNNKTHAFDSKNSMSNVYGQKQVYPRMSNQQYVKNNKLQKLFNPVVCQTSREQNGIQARYRQNYLVMSPSAYQKQKKNLSLERPMTYNPSQLINSKNNNINGNYKTIQTLNSSTPKRRQTQKLKAEKIQQLNATNKKQDLVSKDKFEVQNKSSTPLEQAKVTNHNNNINNNSNIVNNNSLNRDLTKNPLAKLLTQVPKPGIVTITSPTYQRQNKTFMSTTYQNKVDSSIQSVQSTDKPRQKFSQIGKKQPKTYVMPNFLIKSYNQSDKQHQTKQPIQKNPSTQRHQRNPQHFNYPQVQSPQNQYLSIAVNQFTKTNINIISTKSIGTSSEQQIQPMRSRKNTATLLKQQLHFIMETPIQPTPKPISIQYQNFKSAKNLYLPEDNDKSKENTGRIYTQSQFQSQKDQIDIIKQKVQEKKAKFAQLKTDARKILQDDF